MTLVMKFGGTSVGNAAAMRGAIGTIGALAAVLEPPALIRIEPA